MGSREETMLVTVKLKAIEATQESFAEYGQVIEASPDGEEFGPQDAQLDLSRGIPRSVRWVPEESVKPTLKSVLHLNGEQKRWVSQAKKREDENKISIEPQRIPERGEEDEKESGIVYYGPISSTIKKVKLLSLSTCCLSVSLGPVITFMTSPDLNVILKGAVASSVIFLSASTTAALHWFVSPYVHKLRWKPGSDSFEVEMLSWLATHVPRTIKFADIRPPQTNRPFVTFKANGNFYFVDKEHCHNKALLARLTPQEHESALKNL